MRKTVLIDAFPDSAFRHREGAAVACIDVMLATTTLVTAVAQGRRTLLAASHAELRAILARLGPALVAGRLEDAAPGEFELPDSPSALPRWSEDKRPLVLASEPGTNLIANAVSSGPVLVASFRNLSATAAALADYERVALLCAGSRGEFSCEDQMAAAWIAEQLLDQGFEAVDRRTADTVRRWSGAAPALAGWGNSAAQLCRAGRAEEVDFVIAHVDDVDHSCRCEADEVFLEQFPVGVRCAREGLDR
ncbi:MAG TPA: 2-phosphosulfolactate phosphatase [Vicinamibacteria bacterium]|nr:2-phosphosulfolactate phosphatase [Vicinamibacteria bacterium]